jgi:hypothetical protein
MFHTLLDTLAMGVCQDAKQACAVTFFEQLPAAQNRTEQMLANALLHMPPHLRCSTSFLAIGSTCTSYGCGEGRAKSFRGALRWQLSFWHQAQESCTHACSFMQHATTATTTPHPRGAVSAKTCLQAAMYVQQLFHLLENVTMLVSGATRQAGSAVLS